MGIKRPSLENSANCSSSWRGLIAPQDCGSSSYPQRYNKHFPDGRFLAARVAVLTLHNSPRGLVGEFLRGQVQCPVLLLEGCTKEVTYILNATRGRSLHT